MAIPEHLKLGRVWPFTRADNFDEVLSNIFDDIRETIYQSGDMYGSDYVTVGLPGIANGCAKKAQRIFDFFVLDKVGKDKIEDELKDNLELAIYAMAYYRMLEDEESPDLIISVVED